MENFKTFIKKFCLLICCVAVLLIALFPIAKNFSYESSYVVSAETSSYSCSVKTLTQSFLQWLCTIGITISALYGTISTDVYTYVEPIVVNALAVQNELQLIGGQVISESPIIASAITEGGQYAISYYPVLVNFFINSCLPSLLTSIGHNESFSTGSSINASVNYANFARLKLYDGSFLITKKYSYGTLDSSSIGSSTFSISIPSSYPDDNTYPTSPIIIDTRVYNGYYTFSRLSLKWRISYGNLYSSAREMLFQSGLSSSSSVTYANYTLIEGDYTIEPNRHVSIVLAQNSADSPYYITYCWLNNNSQFRTYIDTRSLSLPSNYSNSVANEIVGGDVFELTGNESNGLLNDYAIHLQNNSNLPMTITYTDSDSSSSTIDSTNFAQVIDSLIPFNAQTNDYSYTADFSSTPSESTSLFDIYNKISNIDTNINTINSNVNNIYSHTATIVSYLNNIATTLSNSFSTNSTFEQSRQNYSSTNSAFNNMKGISDSLTNSFNTYIGNFTPCSTMSACLLSGVNFVSSSLSNLYNLNTEVSATVIIVLSIGLMVLIIGRLGK